MGNCHFDYPSQRPNVGFDVIMVTVSRYESWSQWSCLWCFVELLTAMLQLRVCKCAFQSEEFSTNSIQSEAGYAICRPYWRPEEIWFPVDKPPLCRFRSLLRPLGTVSQAAGCNIAFIALQYIDNSHCILIQPRSFHYIALLCVLCQCTMNISPVSIVCVRSIP